MNQTTWSRVGEEKKNQCLGGKIRGTEELMHGKRVGKEKGKLLRTESK